MTPDYALVLTEHYTGRSFSIGETYESIEALDGGDVPPQSALDDLWPQVQYDREYASVQSERRQRYAVETDGMFFAAQREGGDLSEWEAAVAAIKADLPYPDAP